MSYKKDKALEAVIVGMVSIVYVFAVLIFSGTIRSGYHLADDHEILLNATCFQNGAYTWKTILNHGIFDYFAEGIRFRPLYTTLRLLRSMLFGTNYVLWYILVGGEIVLCLVIAHFVVRNMKGGYLQAGLTAVLIITGEQSEIWWRLGPQEPTGLLLCLLCMFVIQKYEVRPNAIKGLAVVILGFLMAASKESFTILLPSLGLFCIGYDFWTNQYANVWEGIKRTICKNFGIFFGMFVVFCLNIYVIIYRVGLLSIEYAGIDREAGISGYIIMLREMLKWDSMKIYEILQILAIVLVIIATITNLQNTKKEKNIVKKLGLVLLALSMISIILGQLILYAKSGMSTRYLIPFTVGFCLLNFYLLPSEMKNVYCQRILLGFGCFVALFLYYGVWKDGMEYAEQGRLLNESFEAIEKSLNEDEAVIVCLGSEELNNSFALYLNINLGMEQVCSWDEEQGFISLLDNNMVVQDFEDAACLVFSEDEKLSDYGVSEDEYSYAGNMGYGCMYLKNS